LRGQSLMRWTLVNALGGLTWLAGLSFAKGAAFPNSEFLAFGDHRMAVGLSFGLAGLALLLWANIRNAA
jgi:hypothetical protein